MYVRTYTSMCIHTIFYTVKTDTETYTLCLYMEHIKVYTHAVHTSMYKVESLGIRV